MQWTRRGMPEMTVALDLGPELENDLQAMARAKGLSVERYVRSLVAKAVHRRSGKAAVALLR